MKKRLNESENKRSVINVRENDEMRGQGVRNRKNDEKNEVKLKWLGLNGREFVFQFLRIQKGEWQGRYIIF